MKRVNEYMQSLGVPARVASLLGGRHVPATDDELEAISWSGLYYQSPQIVLDWDDSDADLDVWAAGYAAYAAKVSEATGVQQVRYDILDSSAGQYNSYSVVYAPATQVALLSDAGGTGRSPPERCAKCWPTSARTPPCAPSPAHLSTTTTPAGKNSTQSRSPTPSARCGASYCSLRFHSSSAAGMLAALNSAWRVVPFRSSHSRLVTAFAPGGAGGDGSRIDG
jgi:hypothetical protein